MSALSSQPHTNGRFVQYSVRVESLRQDNCGQLFIGVARISMHGSQHAKYAQLTPSSLYVLASTFVAGCALCGSPDPDPSRSYSSHLLPPLPACIRFILEPLLHRQDSSTGYLSAAGEMACQTVPYASSKLGVGQDLSSPLSGSSFQQYFEQSLRLPSA